MGAFESRVAEPKEAPIPETYTRPTPEEMRKAEIEIKPKLLVNVLEALLALNDIGGASFPEILSNVLFQSIGSSEIKHDNLISNIKRAITHGVNCGMVQVINGKYKLSEEDAKPVDMHATPNWVSVPVRGSCKECGTPNCGRKPALRGNCTLTSLYTRSTIEYQETRALSQPSILSQPSVLSLRERTPERELFLRERTPERELFLRERTPERELFLRERTPEHELPLRERTPERVSSIHSQCISPHSRKRSSSASRSASIPLANIDSDKTIYPRGNLIADSEMNVENDGTDRRETGENSGVIIPPEEPSVIRRPIIVPSQFKEPHPIKRPRRKQVRFNEIVETFTEERCSPEYEKIPPTVSKRNPKPLTRSRFAALARKNKKTLRKESIRIFKPKYNTRRQRSNSLFAALRK